MNAPERNDVQTVTPPTANALSAPALAAPMLSASVGMHSVVGPRQENQDAVGARVPGGTLLARKGIAFAIADGVSASEAGRVAAEACVQNFLGDYYATPDAWSVKRSGGAVLNALNRWLLGQGVRFRDTRRGYVTTFTGCVLQARQLHVFHVGDTRLYRWRDGHLDLLTRDHRVLLDDGKAVLSRAMGLDHTVDIDYAVHDALPGDSYVLLTDGIHDPLDNAALLRVLARSGWGTAAAAVDVQGIADALVSSVDPDKAVDNMSAVVVRVDALPDAQAGDVLRDWQQLPLLPVLDAGMRIDGLIVERVIAESPRSQVYRVRDEASGAKRVLKAPSPRCEDMDAVRREYATEHWVLRRVQHPRLPKAVEPPRPRSALYLLCEPVEGLSLRQWMREHPRAPIGEVLQIGKQVALALRALHRRDIVHRDVRPENILLDGNGQATLIDLGQCRVAGLVAADGSDDGGPGALEYAAPECTAGTRRVGERSDQFSLAAMLYEMLTGKLPFTGSGTDTLADAHARGDFRRLRLLPASNLNPMLPAWIDGVLARALALEPESRHGDIAEFSDALTAPVRGAAAMAGNAEAGIPLLERDLSRFWRWLALLLLLSNLVTLVLLLR